ncbi:MAG: antitoxin family protein [Thermodesulfobacteriota bacterium]
MKTIQAVYENGVFRPLEPVNLPEHAKVEFEPRLSGRNAVREEAKDRIYKLLAERFESGETDVAARHDEHQP